MNMKKVVLLLLCSSVLFSCSKNNVTPTPEPPKPDPTPKNPENVYLFANQNSKIIETHELAYKEVREAFARDISACHRLVPYSDFIKDSVAIYSQFTADVQKVIDNYSGKYIYSTVSVGKSHIGYYRSYESTTLYLDPSNDAYILYPITVKGRNKVNVTDDLLKLTYELDSRSKMVTASDVDLISPLVEDLIQRYSNSLVCGDIALFKAVYYADGQSQSGRRIKDWSFPVPPTLYELTLSKEQCQTFFHKTYSNLIEGIEFDKPMEAESKEKAIAAAEEVFKYLNGRFFDKRMYLRVSTDCFDESTITIIKSYDITMAPSVWSVEPKSNTASPALRAALSDALFNLEPTGVCYKEGDYHEFKECIREASKAVKGVNDTLNIVECHVSAYYRKPTVVDTLIVKTAK